MKRITDSYLPPTDPGLVVWLTNFSQKITIIGPTVGLSSEELTQVQQATHALIDSLNKVEQKRREQEEAVTAKDIAKKDQLTFLRKTITRIKKHSSYVDSMGGELGVIATTQFIDENNVKPSIWLSTIPGAVRAFFNKQRMPGVVIYSRLKGSMGWEELGVEIKSPYIDRRPLSVANQPEVREYMAICCTTKENVGQQSDIAMITFGG